MFLEFCKINLTIFRVKKEKEIALVVYKQALFIYKKMLGIIKTKKFEMFVG